MNNQLAKNLFYSFYFWFMPRGRFVFAKKIS